MKENQKEFECKDYRVYFYSYSWFGKQQYITLIGKFRDVPEAIMFARIWCYSLYVENDFQHVDIHERIAIVDDTPPIHT